MVVVDPRWTVNDVIGHYSSALPVLKSLGIDSCCGGALTLATVAAKHHIALEVLRSALERAIRAGETGA
jgi:iron-sulfur cluster repair protein YtfE (RIC family)